MPDDSNSPNTCAGAMAPDASTSSIGWGPEIRVDGKRPEWLVDDTPVDWRHDYDDFAGRQRCFARNLFWGGVEYDHAVAAIRLPADHPHYRQPTTPELDPALWDRMVGLVREVAKIRIAGELPGGILNACGVEARAIVADLPKPVDPDLILAREMAKEMAIRSDHRWGKEPFLSEYDSGALDDNEKSGVSLALHAIKRGRELAGEQA